LIYTMTQGGPADLSLTLPLLIYRTGFLFFQFNTAAAQSVFMFVVLAVLIGIYLRVFASGSPDDQ
jgi:multiple sugar transport system permease protein